MTILTTTILKSKASSTNFGSGGVFYFDTVQLSKLTLSSSLIDGSTSKSHGGVIFVNKMTGEILIDSNTIIENFMVEPTMRGSLFYSSTEKNIKLTILSSTIICDTAAIW
jgi:hypothetical protein